MNRQDEIRQKALKDLQRNEVLMLDGHFDFGNGYHGRVYLNPHQLFRQPSTIWRFTQDLIDVLPRSILDATEVVAGPATGGALLESARFNSRSTNPTRAHANWYSDSRSSSAVMRALAMIRIRCWT